MCERVSSGLVLPLGARVGPLAPGGPGKRAVMVGIGFALTARPPYAGRWQKVVTAAPGGVRLLGSRSAGHGIASAGMGMGASARVSRGDSPARGARGIPVERIRLSRRIAGEFGSRRA
jgi:hypothetical protein